jgi:rod shape-determining protein MreD
MIMPRGEQLLLPVNPVFLWLTLIGALVLNTIPLGPSMRWLPDWLALALVFWSVHQPLRVGMGAAFIFGLMMDVHSTGLLGLHALAYVGLVYISTALHRRLLWFSFPVQALQVLPMFIASMGIEMLARIANGGIVPGWSVLIAPVLQALLWPFVSMMLLAPQLRPPQRDDNRPV